MNSGFTRRCGWPKRQRRLASPLPLSARRSADSRDGPATPPVAPGACEGAKRWLDVAHAGSRRAGKAQCDPERGSVLPPGRRGAAPRAGEGARPAAAAAGVSLCFGSACSTAVPSALRVGDHPPPLRPRPRYPRSRRRAGVQQRLHPTHQGADSMHRPPAPSQRLLRRRKPTGLQHPLHRITPGGRTRADASSGEGRARKRHPGADALE
jgi:hypothetical protein